jgi:hypothetical protein
MLKTVSSVINAIGALNYKGTWDAATNTPTITSSVGTKGDYYVVSVDGTTLINGISNWGVGDWIVFNGAVWQRVEGGADVNAVDLSVSGTTTLSGLTASTALALDANKDVVSVTNTGTGDNVLATSPTLTTPALGAATATSINKVALTAPATGSTLTIADGKTLTANHSLTLAGTDATTMTFPATSATIARTDAGQTFTGVQEMTRPRFITSIDDTNGNELIGVTATGSAVNEFTIANAATGNAPTISATGSDTNINIALVPKGSGTVSSSTTITSSKFIPTGGTATGNGMYLPASNEVAVSTNSVERMRYLSDGTIIAGTTDSSFFSNNVTGVGFFATNGFLAGSRGGAPSGLFNRFTSDGDVVEFRRQGSVVGAVNVTTTGTTYATISDYRLKENVQPMIGALAKVDALKPCTYTWKANNKPGQGFIAHELQEVLPECVTGEKDAVNAEGEFVYQGIDTSCLVATLTAAIQELKQGLEQVRSELQTLKGN